MKKRNMIYGNAQSGGFFYPNQANMMPSGFSENNNYMAYGPGVGPNGNLNPNGYNHYDEDALEDRISNLEKKVKRLENKVSKLESGTSIIENSTDDIYMI